jgi:hypothetical protein
MADEEPVSREEAERIQEWKRGRDAIPPAPDVSPADVTNAINASLNEEEPTPLPNAKPEEGSFAAPLENAQPGNLHDQLVNAYRVSNSAPEPATPAAPAAPAEGGSWFQQAWDGKLPAQQELNAQVPIGGKLGPNAAPVESKPQAADSEAAKRSEFNKLRRAEKQQVADYRLAHQDTPRAVVVSRGGMMPSSETTQVTQGPEVSDAERLIREMEQNGVRSAGDNATAELKRDTAMAGLENQHATANAKFAGGEQKAAQKQSDALGAVADRMKTALEAAQKPVVSPAQDLQNMNMGQKLAFILASAGGGFTGRETGKNSFLDGYDQMVNARIDTQKREADQNRDFAKGQENLYGLMKQGFQSDDAARGAMRLMYLQALDTKMKEAQLHYNIDAANPRYMQMQAQIAKEILIQREELAKISGTKVTQENTSRYQAPQVAVVGGPNKNEAETRKSFDKYWTEHKLYDKEADLDTLNNIVRNADKGGAVMKYIAAHPGMSYANAFFAARNDPTQRQLMVDIEREVGNNIQGSGMRSELGRQLGQTLANAQNAQQAYNRLNTEFASEASSGIAAYGGIDAYKRWRQEAEDIQNATNSPVQSQGSDELPKALPPIDETVAPAPVAPGRTAPPPSHHKKK